MADPSRQLAGHKANLHNPTTSEESKLHSKQEIKRLEEELGLESSLNGETNGHGEEVDSHTRHVLAGYKATLSNPNTSDEAKSHARTKLLEAGVDPGASSPKASSHKPLHKSQSPEVEHEHRHIGGLKATLNNPNVSEGAKDRAQTELESLGYEIKNV